MSWRGVFTGALALIALEVLLRSEESVGRFGQMLEGVGDLARRFLSPTVPAIPNVRKLRDDESGAGGGTNDGDGGFSGGGGGGSGGGRSW